MAFLTKSVLAVIMMNATHYVDIGGEKDAVIYYENESTAHMVLPDGATYTGEWSLDEEGYSVQWTNGPGGSWKLDYVPGRIGYINDKGEELGTLSRIEFGNAENIPQ